MMTYPPITAQHRLDVEPELIELLERLFNLVNDSRPATAILHRGGPCADRSGEPAEVVLQLETQDATYLVIKCPIDPERATLSPREQEIVRLVSTGHPNKAIARKLDISQHTVNTHVRRIFDKLGVSSRAEMVAYAIQSGLVARMARYN
jgi:DNA-binding CsgD family transcriptional regulator